MEIHDRIPVHGRKELEEGKYREAVLHLLEATKADPTNDAIYYALAVAHSNQGNCHEAIEAYERAISLSHDKAEANGYTRDVVLIVTSYLECLEIEYRGLGNREKAIETAKRILDLQPNHRQAARLLKPVA